MSVRDCHRQNCKNILCDRYSSEHGYICNECFDELVDSGPETNISTFMKIPKKRVNTAAAEARFNVEFPNVDG